MVLLSTDAPDDLKTLSDDLISFSTDLPPVPEVSLLAFPHRWFVGSAYGCSCGFRHLHPTSTELGFALPQDWFPEEDQDIEATERFVQILRRLVEGGAGVDCIDAWHHGGDAPRLAGTMEVSLADLAPRTFRFFENQRFLFLTATPHDPR